MVTKDLLKEHVYCYVAKKKTADAEHLINRRIGNTDLCFVYAMIGDNQTFGEVLNIVQNDLESLTDMHDIAIVNTQKQFNEVEVKIIKGKTDFPSCFCVGLKNQYEYGFTSIFYEPVRKLLKKFLKTNEVFVMPISKSQALVTDLTADTKAMLRALIKSYDDLQNSGLGVASKKALLTESVYRYNLDTADIKINTSMFRP